MAVYQTVEHARNRLGSMTLLLCTIDPALGKSQQPVRPLHGRAPDCLLVASPLAAGGNLNSAGPHLPRTLFLRIIVAEEPTRVRFLTHIMPVRRDMAVWNPTSGMRCSMSSANISSASHGPATAGLMPPGGSSVTFKMPWWQDDGGPTCWQSPECHDGVMYGTTGLTITEQSAPRCSASRGVTTEGAKTMPAYVVRLIDCASKSTIGGAGTKNSGVGKDAQDVSTLLATWYQLVCQKAGNGWSADVQWITDPPITVPGQAGNPLTINMIIFFVLSPRDSVIKLHPQATKNMLTAVENDPKTFGLTGIFSQGRTTTVGISEVYVTRCRNLPGNEVLPLKLARTGFHETMHNQLAKGDEMHRLSAGFGAESATGSSPNGNDIQLMADRIPTLVPQWLDGFQAWVKNDGAIK